MGKQAQVGTLQKRSHMVKVGTSRQRLKKVGTSEQEYSAILIFSRSPSSSSSFFSSLTKNQFYQIFQIGDAQMMLKSQHVCCASNCNAIAMYIKIVNLFCDLIGFKTFGHNLGEKLQKFFTVQFHSNLIMTYTFKTVVFNTLKGLSTSQNM